MPNIIRDTLPLGTTMIPNEMAKALKKHGIPVFKGKLFKHEGPIDQNLDDWGNPIFTHVNDNTVVLGGAVLALRYLFDNASGFMPDSLNKIFDCNNLSDEQLNTIYQSGKKSSVKLFGVGTGGASAEKFGDVHDPDFKQKQLVDWIPFRISDTPVLTGSTDDVSKYYFRRKFASSPTVQYGWYLKEFENATNVPIISRWKDTIDSTGTGSEITSDVSEDTSGNLIETYGECMIKITADDVRPYFVFNGELGMARYNTIGLFTGVKTNVGTGSGNAADNRTSPETYEDYVDVRLFSVVNMDNVSVKIPSETTYLYRIYAAV